MPTSAANSFEVTGNIVYPIYKDTPHPQESEGFVASATIAAGTVVGRVTASNKMAAYASGNSDGSQNPVGITQYAIVTDASSNITLPGQWGATALGSPVWKGGAFSCAELTGLDANAVTKLGGFVDGSVSTGVLYF